MTLFYEILADIIVVIHVAYLAYVVLGQLAILAGWPLGWQWIRNPWFRFSHMAMILVVAVEAVVQYECPLTTWERELREAAGQKEMAGGRFFDLEEASFTARIFREVLFVGAHPSFVDYLPLTYYSFAAVVVVCFILAPPRLRRRAAPAPVPEPPTASTATTAVSPPS